MRSKELRNIIPGMLLSSQEWISFQLPSPKRLPSRLKLLSNNPKRKSPQAPHLPLLSTDFFFLFLFGKTLSTIFPSKKRLFFLKKILFFLSPRCLFLPSTLSFHVSCCPPSSTPAVVLPQLSRLQDQLLTRFSFKPSYLAAKEQPTSIGCSFFIFGPLWLPTPGTTLSPATFLSLPISSGCPPQEQLTHQPLFFHFRSLLAAQE